MRGTLSGGTFDNPLEGNRVVSVRMKMGHQNDRLRENREHGAQHTPKKLTSRIELLNKAMNERRP